MTNIVENLLRADKVKYTKSFIRKLYNEHPYKNTMYGIEKILEEYNIKTCGVKSKEKDINILSVPSIVKIEGNISDINMSKETGFATILDITKQTINYSINGLKKKQPINHFIQNWTGEALVLLEDENASEPDYKIHKKYDIIKKGQNLFLLLVTLCFIFYVQFIHTSFSFSLFGSVLLNICGIYNCYIIIRKTLLGDRDFGHSFCSVFGKKDCSELSHTLALPIVKSIPLSVLGMSFFISRLCFFLGWHNKDLSLFYIDAIAVLFCVACFSYMIFKKEFCIFCFITHVIVGLLLFMDFIVLDYSMYNNIPFPLLLFPLAIIFFIILIKKNIYYHRLKVSHQDILSKFRYWKTDIETFLKKLSKQEQYDTKVFSNPVVFGNKQAKLQVTILSNPHCGPCAKLHSILDHILKTKENKFSIQYVFTSFDGELEKSNRLLLAAYFQEKEEHAIDIFSEWYKTGAKSIESFYKKYSQYNLFENKIERALNEHKLWMYTNKLDSTPIIMINGYKYPDDYDISDIKYIMEELLSCNFE